jgi:hypothetical protein
LRKEYERRLIGLANTEINYVKNKIKQLENDIAAFGALLIESGLVEVENQGGELRYKVNKVKLDEQSKVQQD